MKYGLFHGRFQPWHDGHLYAAKRAYDECEYLSLGLVNPEAILLPGVIAEMSREEENEVVRAWKSDNNPYLFWERYLLIRTNLKCNEIDLSKVFISPHYPPFIFPMKTTSYYCPPINQSLKYIPMKSKIDDMKTKTYSMNIKEIEIKRDILGGAFSGERIRSGKLECGIYNPIEIIESYLSQKKVIIMIKNGTSMNEVDDILTSISKENQLIFGIATPDIETIGTKLSNNANTYFSQMEKLQHTIFKAGFDLERISISPFYFGKDEIPSKYNRNIYPKFSDIMIKLEEQHGKRGNYYNNPIDC